MIKYECNVWKIVCLHGIYRNRRDFTIIKKKKILKCVTYALILWWKLQYFLNFLNHETRYVLNDKYEGKNRQMT